RQPKNCSMIRGRLASMCKSEMNSVATLKSGSLGAAGHALDFLDDDGLQRRLLLQDSMRPGGDIADLIDHIHAGDHLPKDRITPSGLLGIQGGVIVEVHVELGIAAVRLPGARESHGAAYIAQAI